MNNRTTHQKDCNARARRKASNGKASPKAKIKERKMSIHIRKYLLTIIISVVIIVLSTIPIPENPPLGDVPLIDKWVHMVMYGGLALIVWVDHVVRGKNPFTRKARILTMLYALALGGAMELVQAYLTTCRSGDWIDFEADAVGVLIAMLCIIFIDKLWREKILARK